LTKQRLFTAKTRRRSDR